MNYKEAHEILKNEGIYLINSDGKLKMQHKKNLYGTGYLKGVKLLLKENPKVKQGFLNILRSDGNETY